MLGPLARRGLALVVIAVLFATIFVVSPGIARADSSTAHSAQVAVLAFDSDDAEEQADALTAALRSRIRASQGWSLIETSQSLGMLTAALRCPGKPIPADCEQRIGDQIKSERYIFGYVTKGPQAGQVTAEIHLYQKNKPDTVIRESYADNLKDQNDDTLRKIAQRVLDRLGGTAVGTIVVRMGGESGEVIVDGDKRVPLQNGTARLELAPGGHSVEVVANGQPPQKRNVLVNAGKETIVDLQLAASSNTPSDQKGSEKPFPTRKVVAGGLAVVGIGLGVLAVERFFAYLDTKDHFDNDRNAQGLKYDDPKRFQPTSGEIDVCEAKLKDPAGQIDTTACSLSDDAKSQSIVAGLAGGGAVVLIAAGAYLFFTAPSDDAKTSSGKSAPKAPKAPQVAPIFGWGTGGLSVTGRF